MWYTWTTLLLVSCALVEAAEVQVEEATTVAPEPATTIRAPPRTLDRQAAELAWKSWLQSPESGNQNAPPRRITTKSLFITPLVCPKGQRLDRNGCVQVVTVSKDEHERILLDKLNALFTSPTSGFNEYDYGDDELGPLQLSIPIGLDPQAASLQGDEPSGQAQELSPNYVKVDKKDENKLNTDASVEAELELLKLQNSNNQTSLLNSAGVLNHNVLTNHYPEKPKRDSPLNVTDVKTLNVTTDVGEKELVFGHVDVDPIMSNTDTPNLALANTGTENSDNLQQSNNATSANRTNTEDMTVTNSSSTSNKNNYDKVNDTLTLASTKDHDQSKLNPENDYSDIGEAIKLISRYAEVTTDDSFSKDQKKFGNNDVNILGTRTKLQHRRNRPKIPEVIDPSNAQSSPELQDKYKGLFHVPKNEVYYRYPWQSQHTPTPPPGYPFRHLQDYWQGRNKAGGVYNARGNPRRHHHSYIHNFRPHSSPYASYPRIPETYPEQLKGYIHRIAQHHANQMRSHTNNQDLYSLLGLRHWFSSEGAAKR